MRKWTYGVLGLVVCAAAIVFTVQSNLEARIHGTTANVRSGYPNATYQMVINTDNVDHESGSVLVWDTGTSFDGVSVSSTTSAGSKLVAGVVPYGHTLKAESTGMLQIGGYHPGIKVIEATAIGDILETSATGEEAQVDNTLSAGSFAVCDEVTTSSTTVAGYIRWVQ